MVNIAFKDTEWGLSVFAIINFVANMAGVLLLGWMLMIFVESAAVLYEYFAFENFLESSKRWAAVASAMHFSLIHGLQMCAAWIEKFNHPWLWLLWFGPVLLAVYVILMGVYSFFFEGKRRGMLVKSLLKWEENDSL